MFDKEGVFLAGSHSSHSINKPLNCTVWNEKTTGTTAHGLAMMYKRPFQLIGPENYLEILHNTINFAAPILDENGKIIGALALRHDLGENPWERNVEKLQSHSLGWVSSLAIAIESQLKLSSSYASLKKANQIQGVTLELFEEGIVTIKPGGEIIRANQEGCRILNLEQDQLQGHNISEFLTNRSTLLETLNFRKNVDYTEEIIRTEHGEKPYLVSVRPVLSQDGEDLDIGILKFNYPEKINALVTSRSGASATFTFQDIIGESEPMLKAKKLARRFALSQENILILGESGTGKELFAQAIHNKYCPSGPFIAVNCAAMPRNLIESELFGYERGAFTGAEKTGRPGKIELANGGTLFLDEIGDMPYELQAVILRVLQDKQVMRLGGRRYQKINFRLIAATNQDLPQLIRQKTFREDLFFRLSVLNIEIPPLRERGYDIALLAEYFIEQYARKMGWPVPVIKAEARNKLLGYSWPGNVRQLENAIIYAVNVAEDKVIGVEHLPEEIVKNRRPDLDYTNKDLSNDLSYSEQNGVSDADETVFSLRELEKIAIQNALSRTGYNVAKAAKLLEISKPTLYRKLKEYDIVVNKLI